MTLLRPS